MLLLAVPFASADETFKDVGNDFWAINQINELTSKEIITGYDDNTFRPEQQVTRAEAAIMIARALKLNTDDATASFKDVTASHFAADAIAAVHEAGIMGGYNNFFRPDDTLKRAEMAKILTNAFDLQATAEVTFSDVAQDYWAFDAIHHLAAHKITEGYPNGTFQPEKSTNRAEFAVLLAKALKVPNGTVTETTKQDLIALLADIQENEIALESYEFFGNAEVGLTFPEVTGEDAEMMGELMAMFENINVHLSGAYVKDPMQLEMLMEVVISEEMGLTFEMPIIMTEDAMYMKMDELLGDSEDKFIKMDLAELAEMSGEDAAALDMELQFELSKVLNDMMTKHFIDFYSEVDLNSIEIEHNPASQKAIKFEVTNDSVASFVQVLFEDMLPELLQFMQNPEYAAALGLTAEDLALLVGTDIAFDIEDADFQEMLKELSNALQINELSSHIVIDANNIALDHLLNADVKLTFEGETLGLTVNANLSKSAVNEEVTFQFDIPADEDTISFDELMEFEEDYYEEDFYGEDFYDEDFEFELE